MSRRSAVPLLEEGVAAPPLEEGVAVPPLAEGVRVTSGLSAAVAAKMRRWTR